MESRGALPRMAGAASRRSSPYIIGALMVAAVVVVGVKTFGSSRPVALYQPQGYWFSPPGAQMLSQPVMPPNFEDFGEIQDKAAQPVVGDSKLAADSKPTVPKNVHITLSNKAVEGAAGKQRGLRADAVSSPTSPLQRYMSKQRRAASSGGANTPIDGEVHKLLSSAAMLRQKAASIDAEARRRTTEAEEAEAVDRYLSHAQEELSGYGNTLKKLIGTSSSPARLHAQLKSFPKEAAELHALVDHSMGEADAAAARIARAAAQPAPAAMARSSGDAAVWGRRGEARAARSKHEMHRAFMSAEGQALHAASGSSESGSDAQSVARVMKKLRAVKAFAAMHQEAKKSRTTELVQPSPLIGAVNVKNGELIEGEPFLKYNASELGLEEDGPEGIEKDDEVEEKEDTHAYLCNATCKDAIVDSVVGLTVKVATKCVPECAHSDFIMRTKGEPLPAWTTIDELKEQDETCTPDEEYQQCKLEALRPACNKIGDFVPQYCLVNSGEGICNECRMLEEFAEEKGLEFDLEEEEGGCEEGDEDCDEEEDGEEGEASEE